MRPWGREGFDPRQDGSGAGRARDCEGIEESDSGESGVGMSDFSGGNAPEGGGVVPEHHSPRGEDGERDEDLQEGETFWFIACRSFIAGPRCAAGSGMFITGLKCLAGSEMFISGHY